MTVATDFDSSRSKDTWPDRINIKEFKVSGAANLRGGCQGETAPYGEFIDSYQGDVIICNCWQSWATDVAVQHFPRTRARKVMVSQGFNAHFWHPYSRFAWGLGKWLRAQPYVWSLPKMIKAFDHVILLSPRRDAARFLDHWLARQFFPRRCSIIPNGVNLSDLQNARTDFRKQFNIQSKFLLLNVANYCDRKNQLATLRDFMRVNRADSTLVFIGSEFNDYFAQMKSFHDSNRIRFPLAKVIFLEKTPKETINAAYLAANVFILSAKQETQPLVILDAMACGVPFISTDVGCVSEFPGGWVIPSGEKTTQAIHRLLDDADLRRQLGEQGKKACAEKYDWNQIIDAYEKLFARLIPP